MLWEHNRFLLKNKVGLPNCVSQMMQDQKLKFNFLVLSKSQPRWNKKSNEFISKSMPRILNSIQSKIGGRVRNVKSREIKKYVLILRQSNMPSQRSTDITPKPKHVTCVIGDPYIYVTVAPDVSSGDSFPIGV